ncbi:UNVERIFIED_CONTAM: MFS transporter, partial [Bacteroidetes bacterium 56_B9]
AAAAHALPRRKAAIAVAVLVVLLFSKNVYSASLGSYYTFYLMKTFDVSVQGAQLLLFLYLGSVVLGTLAGGMVGDRIGRIPVMWFS